MVDNVILCQATSVNGNEELKQHNHHTIRKLSLVLTESCNLRCRYCYARLSKRWQEQRRMVPALAEKIIRRFISHYDCCEFVQFFGGEPSLNLDCMEAVIEEIAAMVARGGLRNMPRFGIVTNGVFRDTERTIDLLKRHNVETTISLDGPARIHDALRVGYAGSPTFDRVSNTLTLLLKAGLPVAIETVYTTHHLRECFSIVDSFAFCLDQGVRKLMFQTASPPAPPDLNPLLGCSLNKLVAYHQEAVDWWFGKLLTGEEPFLDVYFKQLLSAMLSGLPAVAPEGCPAGASEFSIGPDGRVFACQLLYGNPRFAIGNALEEGLPPERGPFPATSDDFAECRPCAVRHWCQPCVALNDFWGDMEAPPSPECTIRRAVILRIAQWALERLVLPENEMTRRLRFAVSQEPSLTSRVAP